VSSSRMNLLAASRLGQASAESPIGKPVAFIHAPDLARQSRARGAECLDGWEAWLLPSPIFTTGAAPTTSLVRPRMAVAARTLLVSDHT